MKTLRVSLFIVAAVFMASCSTVKVVTEMDQAVDISSYETSTTAYTNYYGGGYGMYGRYRGGWGYKINALMKKFPVDPVQ